MSEHSSKEPVSHSHANTPTKHGQTIYLATKNSLYKKSQLQEALVDYNRENNFRPTEKKSILSDEGNVLHVGKEKQGTIIKDTRHKRWSLLDAIKNSLSGWLIKKKDTVTQPFKKPIPRNTMSGLSTRTETIKKIVQNPGASKKSRFSVRIKPKDVLKEIGDTKPRWTHIIEDDEMATPPPIQPTTTSSPKVESKKLIEAPDTALLLPEHTGVVKQESVKKIYRTPRISHQVITPAPAQEPAIPIAKSNLVVEDKIRETKPLPVSSQETGIPENIPTNDDAIPPPQNEVSQADIERTPVKPSAPHTQRDTVTSVSSVSISMVVMIIIFIGVIGMSSVFWNIIETDTGTSQATNETHHLVQADHTIDTTLAELPRTIQTNTGFTKFSSDTTNEFVMLVTSWNELFARGTLAVDIGAFDARPFVVIQTDSKETALVGMLSVEESIPSTLLQLFGITNTAHFSRGTLAGKSIRIFKDTNASHLVYFVRSDGVVFITSTTDDLAALIDHTK